MRLNHEQIAAMIPHGENMCLLDQVLAWDQQHIRCSADPGLDPNPLTAGSHFHCALLIEYAGQAAAVHGALLGDNIGEKGPAYLGAVKHADLLHDPRADQGPIQLEAMCVLYNRQGAIYDVSAWQEQVLLRGRLILNQP